jgi:hypothetical protein
MPLGPVDKATVTASDVASFDASKVSFFLLWKWTGRCARGRGVFFFPLWAHRNISQAHASDSAASGLAGTKPTIDSCINIYDFEAIASRVVNEQGWAYYSSGADDEITLRENHNAFHRIWLVVVVPGCETLQCNTQTKTNKINMKQRTAWNSKKKGNEETFHVFFEIYFLFLSRGSPALQVPPPRACECARGRHDDDHPRPQGLAKLRPVPVHFFV